VCGKGEDYVILETGVGTRKAGLVDGVVSVD
jgi:hypothetical protein